MRPSPSIRPATPAPLWAVFAFTFLGSISSGVATNGIYFLTKQAFDFSTTANYALGMLTGVTYIAGALGTGPLLHGLRARWPSFTPRTFLVVLSVLMGLICMIPAGAAALSGPGKGAWGAWGVWVMVTLYSPLNGMLWPNVESFLSGGRWGTNLRRATGWFNSIWSGALVFAFWAMAPLVKDRPLLVLVLLGVVHVLSAVLVIWLPPAPAGTPVLHDHEKHPPVYASLLGTFRILLPTSYLISSALAPYLPTALERLRIDVSWHTPLAAAWLAARVCTFALLSAWQGWHGRWSMAVVGGALLLVGFGGTVLAPRLADREMGIAVFLLGLVAFGIGMAVIYCGALYYAMAVGDSHVEAGGMHEALIGVGYTLGPLMGVLAGAAVERGVLAASSFEAAMLLSVGVCGLVAAGLALRRVYAHHAG